MIKNVNVVPVDGGQPTGTGSGEAILDVEDVSALAPQARARRVRGSEHQLRRRLDAYAAIVNADQDRVISTSWGFCEQAEQNNDPGDQQAENILFEQAAAQGQTMFSAAGDTGDDDCNAFRTPDSAAGSAVHLRPTTPRASRTWSGSAARRSTTPTQPPQERVWNDGNIWGGGGGGISQSWTMPSWQRAARVPGVVLPGSAHYKNAAKVLSDNGFPSTFCAVVAGATTSTPCRLVPDVAAQARRVHRGDHDLQRGVRLDHVSAGPRRRRRCGPGMLADVNASATCTAQSATANGVGFASPLLYAVASNPQPVRGLVQRHHGRQQRHLRARQRPGVPGHQGLRPDHRAGLAAADRPRTVRPGLAFYLCSAGARPPGRWFRTSIPSQGSTAGGEKVTVVGSGFGSASTPGRVERAGRGGAGDGRRLQGHQPDHDDADDAGRASARFRRHRDRALRRAERVRPTWW